MSRIGRIGLAVATAGFATFVNVYTPQAILPEIAHAFAIGLPETSYTITVSLLAVALVAPFAGAASDRLGRKRLIVAAAALMVLPTLLIASSRSFATVLAWRFVQGLLAPFVFAVTVAYIAEECPGADGIRITGLYASGTIVGGFCGRFVAGLVASWSGWRASFVALGLLTAAAAALVQVLLPTEARFRGMAGGVASVLRTYRGHLTNPRLLATAFVGFGLLFSLVASFTFVNFRLAAPPFSLGPSALGSVFAVYLVGAVATTLAAALAARIGRRVTFAGGMVVGLLGQALTLGSSLWMIVAGLAATCIALFVAQALSLTFIGSSVTRARSAAVGVYVSVYYVGGAIGGAAPIPVWHAFGWPGVVGLVCLVMLGMLGLAARYWTAA